MTNPERVRWLANPFRVNDNSCLIPGLSLRSNPGLKLANAFGVFIQVFKLMRSFFIAALAIELETDM